MLDEKLAMFTWTEVFSNLEFDDILYTELSIFSSGLDTV